MAFVITVQYSVVDYCVKVYSWVNYLLLILEKNQLNMQTTEQKYYNLPTLCCIMCSSVSIFIFARDQWACQITVEQPASCGYLTRGCIVEKVELIINYLQQYMQLQQHTTAPACIYSHAAKWSDVAPSGVVSNTVGLPRWDTMNCKERE